MSDKLPIDFFDAQSACDLYRAGKRYRENSFEPAWVQCSEADEDYENTGVSKLPDELQYAVNVPIVSLNNQRKVSSVGIFSLQPQVHSESIQPEAVVEAREAALRWGFRTSKIENALLDKTYDLVSLGQGWNQIVWDNNELNGKGAPKFMSKDFDAIVVDPRRRDRDPNKDCRYIFEIQKYTLSDLKGMWPEFFENYGVGMAHQTGGYSATIDEEMADPYRNISAEGGLVAILRCEYVTKNDQGQRRVYYGILDPGTNQWIEEPEDNGLGMFSYLPLTLRLRRKHAYPVPPNWKELPLGDLYNLFMSLAVSQGIIAGAPPIFYDESDPLLKDAFEDAGYALPGNTYPYRGKMPEVLYMPNAQNYLGMAGQIANITNESGQISAVQKGETPRGVTSGRAINSLQQAADAPLDQLREAIKFSSDLHATAIDRMLQRHIVGYRTIVDSSQGSPMPIPLNVREGTPEYASLSDPKARSIPKYQSARVYKGQEDTEGTPMSVYEAQQEIVSNPEYTMELFLNDLKYGNIEISVTVVPETSPEKKAETALMLLNIEPSLLGHVLKELGTPNASQLVKYIDQKNQLLQMGKQVAENPQILEIYQTVMNDPMLLEFVQNPEARGHMKDTIKNYKPPVTSVNAPAKKDS